ncbi:MAG: CopG family transcriptional regulator [Deltaproteobacteria bacterium]|nr:CopG family transcriptional regulator [Deltaproteobacteria bacterium]
MEKQNVTLSLPKNLLQKAKILAARHEKSLSELIRQSLEEKVRQETGYNAAKQRQLRLLKSGMDLGTMGKIATTREELHARR